MLNLKKFFVIITLLLVVFTAPNAFANPRFFEEFKIEGIVPYETEEVEAMMNKAVEDNDYKIQYTIGYMFEKGLNVPESYREAARWYKMGVDNGHIASMISLGIMYKRGGEDFPPDYHRALALFKKAIKGDSAYAWYEIAEIHEKGLTGYVKLKNAKLAYLAAAKGGVLNAHMRLAVYYHHGILFKQDIKKAIKRYNYVYNNTKSDIVRGEIKKILGQIYSVIALNLSDEIERFKWFKIAAEFDDLPSMELVASSYKEGINTLQDFNKAIAMYKRAAKLGGVYSMVSLGYMYANGISVDKDVPEALKWYKKATEFGSAEAAWHIGNIYFRGLGVSVDKEEARRWFGRQKRLQSRGGNRGRRR